MGKAVLLPVHPKWLEKICHKVGVNDDGSPVYEKGDEIRKNRPKEKVPFRVYLYCTKPKTKHDWGLCLENGDVGLVCNCNYDDAIRNGMKILSGKVIGEFICDDITKIIKCGSRFVAEGSTEAETNRIARSSCLDFDDMKKYLGAKDGYAWHISNLVIYDEPKELNEFRGNPCNAVLDIQESCTSCGKCGLKRPPQSWCYVEGVETK